MSSTYSNAKLFGQTLHSRHSSQCRYEPAVANFALDNIIGGSAVDEKLRLVKNLVNSATVWNVVVLAIWRESIQAEVLVRLEIKIQVPVLQGHLQNQ